MTEKLIRKGWKTIPGTNALSASYVIIILIIQPSVLSYTIFSKEYLLPAFALFFKRVRNFLCRTFSTNSSFYARRPALHEPFRTVYRSLPWPFLEEEWPFHCEKRSRCVTSRGKPRRTKWSLFLQLSLSSLQGSVKFDGKILNHPKWVTILDSRTSICQRTQNCYKSASKSPISISCRDFQSRK